MSGWVLAGVFVVSVALMSLASARMTETLERIGGRLRFPEALLGIVTALGADAPEIASALVALYSGDHDVGQGTILGSNVYNLAGLLGASAVVAGRVEIGRPGLVLNGGVALLVAAALTALVVGWLPPAWTLPLLAALVVPYVYLSSLRSAQIRALRIPPGARRFLDVAVEHAHRNARKRESIGPARGAEAAMLVLWVAVIVGGAEGAVRAAVGLADRWSIPHVVVGTLILAVLTSIPNTVAAVHLAREGRGAAVIAEALNSNTINALAGICIPALALRWAVPSRQIVFTAWWLLGMSVVAVLAGGGRKGLGRAGGTLVIALYVLFIVVMAATV